MKTQLQAGDPAPDLAYTTPDGGPARLSELWAEGPALVLWPRHCG